ncbi:mitochondrial-like import inner membrane translocase subunit TIM16-like, partial [Trifolium medium]|nr:mitochondrial-like import inner membrane translocase subunit TIM16-like [Trifolium medium]
ASRNGVAQETMQNTIRKASKTITEQEARQILGVTEKTPWEDILK